MANAGWKYESARHALAAQGVKTGRKYNFDPSAFQKSIQGFGLGRIPRGVVKTMPNYVRVIQRPAILPVANVAGAIPGAAGIKTMPNYVLPRGVVKTMPGAAGNMVMSPQGPMLLAARAVPGQVPTVVNPLPPGELLMRRLPQKVMPGEFLMMRRLPQKVMPVVTESGRNVGVIQGGRIYPTTNPNWAPVFAQRTPKVVSGRLARGAF